MRPLRAAPVALLAVVLLLSVPWAGPARAEAARADAAEALAAMLDQGLHLAPGLPGTRVEADGSTTLLGTIADLPGTMARTPLEATLGPLVEAALQPATGQLPAEAGLFTRAWQDGNRDLVTVGAYVVDQAGKATNVNVLALEGTASLRQLVVDIMQRDALPIAVNLAPFVVNYAMPTSLTLFLVLLLAFVAVALAAGALAVLGFGDVAASVVGAMFYVALSPLFMLNILYPYHLDAVQGETYRDFPDTFVWQAVQRTPAGAVWQGAYLQRHGAYWEGFAVRDGEVHLLATAWKRDVAGAAVRVDDDLTKLPGVYVRQDIERDFGLAPGGQEFEAESQVTSGVYEPALGGELPGAAVWFHEHKQGPQVFVYPEHQVDTIAVGVETGDAAGFVPLVGTQTASRHRPYVDVTNDGRSVAAIEAYRVTSYGAFVDGAYVPVAGFDTWGERQPLDLWVLLLALGQGLGDQDIGDHMVRVGSFVQGRFVAHAGVRVDDHFDGHRHPYRAMVSAGLFVADPLDPGQPVPGEAPDGAQFVPLLAATYDGAQGLTAWALANAFDNPRGMGTWLASAGPVVLGSYKPLVGVEYVPGSHHEQRAARETYRVGVFTGTYSVFIPLVGVTWDGDQTSAAWAVRLGTSTASLGPREGSADATAGAYLGSTYIPVLGVAYAPRGTASHPMGHTVTVGAYLPSGAFLPLVEAGAHFDAPPTSWAGNVHTCHVQATVRVVPTGTPASLTPPCLRP